MKLVKTFEVSAPPEIVGQVLCSERYQLEAERLREEVVSTKVHVVERTAERFVFEVQSVEYKRGKLGNIDRSGTLDAVTRYDYRSGDRTLRWTYRGAAGERVLLDGVYRLETAREGVTRVVHDMNIEVRIPLLGNQIAKLIAKEFDRTWPPHEALIARHAREVAGQGQP